MLDSLFQQAHPVSRPRTTLLGALFDHSPCPPCCLLSTSLDSSLRSGKDAPAEAE
jgi:hypothetical protein